MEIDRNIPTYEELFYQHQQEVMLQLQPVPSSSTKQTSTYHPSFYTQNIALFLVEKNYQFGSKLIH